MEVEPTDNEKVKKWTDDPTIKICLTKAGLCILGPKAFPSNMHKSDFVYEGQPYSSPKQGFQHLNASHHLVFEIAEKFGNQ